MGNYQGSGRQSALEIFEAGYDNRSSYKGIPDNKRYFISLRKTIIDELETTGFCTLIETLLESNYAKIDIILYSVFADIREGYQSGKYINVLEDNRFSNFIPYVVGPYGKGIKWSECREYGSKGIPEYKSTLRDVRYIIRKTYVNNQKNSEVLRAESEGIREKASEDAAGIRERARAEAERIRDTAHAEAAGIREEAQSEAAQILEDARNSADSIIEEAREKTRSQSKELAEKLVSEYLENEQTRYRKEFDDKMREFSASYLQEAGPVSAIHSEMCEKTDTYYMKWVGTLDETLRKINAAKDEFYRHMHDWQVALYPAQLKPLAKRYLELYRIVNVDKLIREEILFEESMKDDADAIHITEEDTEHDAVGPVREPDHPAISGLQELNRKLSTFLRLFEASLNGLDLYVFYPKPGERFDSVWHTPENEGEECIDRIIAECIVPGIAKKADDELGDDVLVPALVRVASKARAFT